MDWKDYLKAADWAKLGGWAFKASAGLFFAITIGFPLQVKYEVPEASLKQIYIVFYDYIMNMINQAEPNYRKISTEDLCELLADDPESLVVVDARSEQFFRDGHIEGAVLVPFQSFRNDFHVLPKDKTVVLTCDFGRFSAVAANQMLKAGYTKVYDHTGGMEEWMKLKKPTVKGFTQQDMAKPERVYYQFSNPIIGSFLNSKQLKRPVYLDYNATTPLDPKVLECMMPYFTHQFGNAASTTHSYGTEAERAVYRARQQVATILHAESPNEIVFTSGASESNNLAIKGVAYQRRNEDKSKNHIITCVTEHKAVLDTCKALEVDGFHVTYLKVKSDGLIDLDELSKAIGRTTCLVSIMLANNEIGVIQPFQEIGRLCHDRGVLFHTDGTQGVGKFDLNVQRDHIDLVSISAHKIYGPKGTGALYVRSSVRLQEQINGGGHEHGMRSGTLNVPGIVGLGESCRIAEEVRVDEGNRIQERRDRLLEKLSTAIPDLQVNGSMKHRLGGNLHLSFAGVTSEQVLMELGGDVAISSGSACNSRRTGPSHVVVALGIKPDMIGCTLRFGIGRFTTEGDVDFAAKRLIEVITQARKEKRASKSKN